MLLGCYWDAKQKKKMKKENKKNPNRITIFLTDRELEILTFMQKQKGTSSLPLVVHLCISEYHQFMFVNKEYMKDRKGKIKAIPEVEITYEQKCERSGGKVFTENGIIKCKQSYGKDNAMIRVFPVEMIDKYI